MIDRKKEAISQDQEIPPKLLEKMSPDRLKNFIKRGSIGEMPKSAFAARAQKNLGEACEKLKKENAGGIKKLEAAEKKVEKLEIENAELTVKNKGFKGLEKNLKSKSILLEKLSKAHENLRKEHGELQKQLKEQAKNG